jgi:phosphomannomutase/phosphomannomutase/phosphoglucomutase
MFLPVIFREYDIRGVYNKEFDKDFAYLLGRAYAQYFFEKFGKKGLTVTLGHDARLSSLEIKAELSRGLQDSGVHVLSLGLVTSPISYFTTFGIPGVDGAIMITGSHNPPDYNGFKISVGKSTIFGEEIQKIYQIIQKAKYVDGQGSEKSYDIFPKYIDRYKNEFGTLAGLKVVLDCGNGAAGCVVRKLFEAVGLTPTILFEQPDGRFPNHHPDPTVEKNLKDLQVQVAKEKAVVGIGFDGDADRIGLIDHTGRMIYGDELMVLISRAVLEKNKGAKIIGDVKCSDRLYTDIEKHGGVPIMWKTGHSLIKEKVKIEKAPFGGEMSGHVFFADRNYGYDDALYAALRICEILSQTGKTIPELLEGLPVAYNTPELRIDTTEEKKVAIVEKLKSVFKPDSKDYKINLIDGIRLSFPDGWALARASNTQPVIVLRYESSTQEGLDRIRSQIEKIVQPML